MRIAVLSITVLLAASVALASSLTAAPNNPVLHGPAATAAAVLDADLAFEAESLKAGAAQAFRDHMDPSDGLEFAGGAPVRGAAAIGQLMAKDSAGETLSWAPVEVFASAGDLGVVWGTWSLVPKPSATPLTGRYVTVWRRDKAGKWKGLIDIGTPDP